MKNQSADRCNLTKGMVDDLEPRHARYWVNDSRQQHLQLVVHPSGKKTYRVVKSFEGRPVTIKLGEHPLMVPESARRAAREALGDLARGVNPNERKRETRKEREKKEERLTLAQALAQYLAAKDLRQTTVRAYTVACEQHLAKYLHQPLEELTAQQFQAVYLGVAASSPSAANSMARVLRAIWGFHFDPEDPSTPRNPVKALSRRKLWRKVPRREGYIPPEKLGAWLRAVHDLPNLMTDPKADADHWRDLFLFWTLTGCRNMEAKRLRWSDVDMTSRTFTLVGTKNGSDHTLPITEPLLEVLNRRKKATGGQGKVFPLGHHRDAWKHVIKAAEVEGITPHDLRRSFVFYAGRAGVGVYEIKQLVNHAVGTDITGGYAQVATVADLRHPATRVAQWIVSHRDRMGVDVIRLDTHQASHVM